MLTSKVVIISRTSFPFCPIMKRCKSYGTETSTATGTKATNAAFAASHLSLRPKIGKLKIIIRK